MNALVRQFVIDVVGITVLGLGLSPSEQIYAGEDEPLPSVQKINAGIRRAIERAKAEEGRDDPVPPGTELVMTPGMKITATTPDGTITITAGTGLKRSYTWDGATRSVNMWPITEKEYGKGIYFPGPGYHWKEHHGISRAVVGEEWLRFDTRKEAEEWIKTKKSVAGDYVGPPSHYVYRNDGLLIHWGKTPQRKQLSVDVYQIFIAGKKPQELSGADDKKVIVEQPKELPTNP